MAWPLCGASGSGPGAEQRESKLVGGVGVCAKALQQWAGLVDTILCHARDATYRVSRVLLDWVHGLLMCVSGGVVVLSGIKIGAPASKGGTWHHFWTYGAPNCPVDF